VLLSLTGLVAVGVAAGEGCNRGEPFAESPGTSTTSAQGAGGTTSTPSDAGGHGGAGGRAGAGGHGGTGGHASAGGSGGLAGHGGSGGHAGAGGTPTDAGAGGSGGHAGHGGAGGAPFVGGLGAPCHYGDDCGPDLYCDAAACGAGTCAKRPAPASASTDPAPVCGCDESTYWNADVAHLHGVPVGGAGACPGPLATPCGPNTPCPSGQLCNRPVADAAGCAGAITGECWSVPAQCPLTGPMGRACSNGQCATQCALMQSQNPWYADPACN
jgi:hypothetical protein